MFTIKIENDEKKAKIQNIWDKISKIVNVSCVIFIRYLYYVCGNVVMAGRCGFEPQITGSKPVVLPITLSSYIKVRGSFFSCATQNT